MSTEKLSVSFERSLAMNIKSGAADAGVSVSTWLAEAAADRLRAGALRAALDADAPEVASLRSEELDAIVAEARAASVTVHPGHAPG